MSLMEPNPHRFGTDDMQIDMILAKIWALFSLRENVVYFRPSIDDNFAQILITFVLNSLAVRH